MVVASGPYSMPAGTNAQKRKQSQQDQLLAMLGQMNPAQNLQGLQSSFGMPNMQSVNGLLGR